MVSRPTEPLQIAISADFLPPISRWSRLGGLALVGIFRAARSHSPPCSNTTLPVKAPAVVRPEGDLRIVEATATGQVQQILVAANDNVERGDPLVILDDAEVRIAPAASPSRT